MHIMVASHEFSFCVTEQRKNKKDMPTDKYEQAQNTALCATPARNVII